MKYTWILLGLLLFTFMLMSWQCKSTKSKKYNMLMSNYTPGDTYTSDWEQVVAYENQGLTQDARKKVEAIMVQAEKDDNAAQVVKCLLHLYKFDAYTEESSEQTTIANVLQRIDSAAYPLKPVLQSLAADFYWQYYRSNQYQILERTPVAATAPIEDFETWDATRFALAIKQLHYDALSEAERLKTTPVTVFDDILLGINSSNTNLRPTLYDFLAHRAIDYFKNDAANISKAADQFILNDEAAFADANTFSQHTFSNTDPLSFKFYALQLYQALVNLHLNSGNQTALIDIDLQRMKYVEQIGRLPNKTTLTIDAYEKMKTTYANNPYNALTYYELASLYNNEGNSYNAVSNKEVQFEKLKAIELCNECIEKYGKDTKEVGRCINLKNNIEQKQASVRIAETVAPSQKHMALIRYTNLDSLYFRIIKKTAAIVNNLDDLNRQEEKINFLAKQKFVDEWSVGLKNFNDYQTHSTEIIVPENTFGEYFILAGSSANFSSENNTAAYDLFQHTNIVCRTYREKNKITYYATHRQTGQALSNIKYTIAKREYNQRKRRYDYINIDSGTADGEGKFSYSFDTNQADVRVRLQQGEDTYDLTEYYYQNRDYKRKEQKLSYFFTDRSIYRPGQKVYFKAIHLNKQNKSDDKQNNIDHSLLINEKLTVKFLDVNYQLIEEKTFTTNQYGSINGSFDIPTNLLNGRMQLTDGHGTASISVEEYKRPKFEVSIDPPKATYRLNDVVSVTGNAKAYAGNNIDGAKVQYRVERNAIFPYWRCWWIPRPQSSGMEVAQGNTTTNEKGEFTISFKAIPDLSLDNQDKPQFNYTVYADVTDINGETQSTSTVVSVGTVAMLATVNIPSKLNINSTKTNFDVSTTNLNNQFEEAEVNIKVKALKTPNRIFRSRLWEQPDVQSIEQEEFYNTFPNDIYADENQALNWKRGKTVFDKTFTTSKESKISLTDLKTWTPGKYLLTLDSKDKFGQDVKLETVFTVFDTYAKTIPTNEILWANLSKEKAQPSETVTLTIGTAAENVKVFYQLVQDKLVLKQEWLTLNKEQKNIDIVIKESHRGGLGLRISAIKFNRPHQLQYSIAVPWTNKELAVSLATYRNKMYPGASQEWRINISGTKQELVAAELLASMYDASLDAFKPHNWYFDIYPTYGYYNAARLNVGGGFGSTYATLTSKTWSSAGGNQYYRKNYYYLNNYGFDISSYRYNYYMMDDEISASPRAMTKSASRKMAKAEMSADAISTAGNTAAMPAPGEEMKDSTKEEEGVASNTNTNEVTEKPVQIRKNLQEMAFFFPDLRTNNQGDIVLSFDAPEALTRWKIMAFAHTKDLAFGQLLEEAITQKELMVTPNPPRFFRENDTLVFTSKIANISDKPLTGTATLQLMDAATGEKVNMDFQHKTLNKSFKVAAEQSTAVSWQLIIPSGLGAVTYQVVAKAANFSDGEENTLPILTNSMLVTESLPLPVRGKGQHNFTFNKLAQADASNTLRHERLTLEFSPQPVWYAVQALPYLMEYPHQCSEQIFSRYYANTLAAHLANSYPKVKQVFTTWKEAHDKMTTNGEEAAGALLSNLEKNKELKALLLEETPWVLQAKSESERKQRLGLLFDLDKMATEQATAEQELIDRQMPSGAWSWFPGGRESYYITRHLITGFGHLDKLGIKDVRNKPSLWTMVKNALLYIDEQMYEDYQDLKKYQDNLDKNHLGYNAIQYLYCRSFFTDVAIKSKHKEAYNYWLTQAEKYWLSQSKYMQAMIALSLYRTDDASKTPTAILEAFRQNATYNDEMGMYFKENTGGWYWYQAPIETQALIIEAFSEIENDTKAVEALKVWLLKQKQTQDWKTTKATAKACYALLLQGNNWLTSEDGVIITIGNKTLDPSNDKSLTAEAGTGYFKTTFLPEEINTDMANISVQKPDEGVAWGAVYWQYFEQLDKITFAETNLSIKKDLFKQTNTKNGKELTPLNTETVLEIGDIVKVRIEIRTDRAMEYVHLKDMRAAAFEPINVISRYKYQGGLGYYESTKDAATNFFIDWLPKGTYVFEYNLRVNTQGAYSNGITTMQCMYAPEFTTHSEGIRVNIK